MRRSVVVIVIIGLLLGIGIFFLLQRLGFGQSLSIIITAILTLTGILTPYWNVIWRFYKRLFSKEKDKDKADPNNERDEKRYLGRRIKKFKKEEEFFIPLQLNLKTEDGNFENIAQVLKEHERFVLIGAPGAGKSTTLRQLWKAQAELYRQNESEELLPLWVFLGRGDNPEDAAELVSHWWTNEAILPDSSEKRLKQDGVFLFFDGLNEMPDDTREKRTQSLKTFLAEHPDTPVIITCRERDYEDEKLQLGLPTVHVQPLDENRIKEFIYKRLGDETLWDELQKNEALLALAQNPYNLTMLIEVYKGGSLPQDLNDLYRLYIEITYKQYKAENKVRLSWERLKSALETLAFRMIVRDKATETDEAWCRKQIGRKAIRDGLDLGVLVVDEDTIRFYHQSLHQYFALPKLIDALEPKWHNAGIMNFRRRSFIRQIGDLQAAGAPAVPALIEVLGTNKDRRIIDYDRIENVRSLLRWMLVRLGSSDENEDELSDLVVYVLSVRMQAASSLGEIGDKRAVKPLIEALNDANRLVRTSAVIALGEIADKRAVDPLIVVLKDENRDEYERETAAKALGNIGDSRAVESLIAALSDENWSLRWAVGEALGQIGESAVEPLIDVLADVNENKGVRAIAAEALGQIGDSRAINSLIAALRDEDGSVQIPAAEALAKIGESAVDPLIDVLKAETSGVQAMAIFALRLIGGSRVVEPIIDALTDANQNVREAAAHALTRIGDSRAVDALIFALKDMNEKVRLDAVRALERIGDSRAVVPLSAALTDRSVHVRMAAASTLADFGDARAVFDLIVALNDEDRWVRFFASKALEKIGTAGALEAVRRYRKTHPDD